jgi:hypothetical protein
MIGTQALKTSSTSSSKLACLYMVQVSSQKYRRSFLQKIFSDLACSQIWLHLPVNHRHFGYNTNLPQKKKLNYRANPSFILFEGCTSSKVQ